MKSTKRIWLYLILVSLTIGSGCSSSTNDQPVSLTDISLTRNTSQSLPVAEATSIPYTLTPSPISSATTISTPTIMPLPTLTPPLTLPPDKAQGIVKLMLQTNGGCELPCWWGIKPGISTWDETANALSAFASEIETYKLAGGVDANGNMQPEFVAIINYLNNNISKSFQLTARNGIIDSINLYDDTGSYKLSALIKSFGDPAFIYVNTVYTSPSGKVPFVLVIYYPSKGIVAAYIAESGVPIKDKNVVFCAQGINPTMLLWNPEQDLNDQYQKSFLKSLDYWVNDGGLHQIEEVSESSKSTIYATLRETGCINVSVELWEKIYFRNKP